MVDARAREAAQEVELRRFLQLAFEPLGDLLDGLLDACARPGGMHDHRLDDECRVFGAAKPEERQAAGKHPDDHDVDDERPVAERPLREIEPAHCSSPSRRTF